MGYVVLRLNHLISRDGPLGKCIKVRMDNEIDDRFTGLDHFLAQLLVNEYRGLCNPKINGTRVSTVKVLEEIFIFLLTE